LTLRTDIPPRRSGLAANRSYPVAINRHIAGKCGHSRTVNNCAAAYDNIVHYRAYLEGL
jgi:hypothetical protein